MEVIQKMPNESFSCGWHNNINPSFNSFEASFRHSFDGLDSSSFIDMEPELFSMHWTDSSSFDFNLPSWDTSVLVHADQIFSNGNLLPLNILNPLKTKDASSSSDSVLTRSVLLNTLKELLSQNNQWVNSVSTNTSPTLCSSRSMHLSSDANKFKFSLLGSSTKSPWKFFRKYLNFLIPLCKKVKNLKRISSRAIESCGDLPRSTPGISNAFSDIERRRGKRVFDVDIESSIHDAVLHCKRTFEN